jgi:4'-phosphopantetheinyl transferase EntD
MKADCVATPPLRSGRARGDDDRRNPYGDGRAAARIVLASLDTSKAGREGSNED